MPIEQALSKGPLPSSAAVLDRLVLDYLGQEELAEVGSYPSAPTQF